MSAASATIAERRQLQFRRRVGPQGPRQRVLVVTGFAMVVIAALAAATIVLREAAIEALVGHTFLVHLVSRRLMSDLQDAEIGQRGFLLTRDDKHLEPFSHALVSVPETLSELRKLNTRNPDQLKLLGGLQQLIAAKLAELRLTVTLARQGHNRQVADILDSGHGTLLMRKIQSELDLFSRTELGRLTAQQSAVKTLRKWLLASIALSLTAATALAGFLLRSTVRALDGLRERTEQLESEIKLRREAEETLRQAQKLEAVGQLAGGIAHDFNNLLTIILGNLDTIQRRLAGSALGPDSVGVATLLSRPLELAIHGARSAARLTQRLLAFSRRQALEPGRVDINRLVTDLVDLLRRTLGEAISFETVLAGGLWPTLADANQLESALVNLCVNARDAMPAGGRLTIETTNAHLDEDYARLFGDVISGQYVMLSVTDTGTGMSQEVISHAFEPFFTTKSVGEGTGLGLAMVHGFVKQSGGHVRIYSELDHGTTIKLYLPRLLGPERRVSPASKDSESGIPLAGPEETVLVVEDDDRVREYAASVLEELGYRVVGACNATDAMAALTKGQRIDLLFTDIVLGDTNGRQLAKMALDIRTDLPVLFTTGYSRNAIFHNGRLDPGVHLLGKPYTRASLGRKVREVLDNARAQTPV